MTVLAVCLAAPVANAQSVLFNTGNPDGLMAMASRPPATGVLEIEAADDFLFSSSVSLTGATFIGLVPAGATITRIVVEIYRVFPADSNIARTPNVPTRINSPSDVAFTSRDTASSNLTINSVSVLNPNFTANNSVLNGIHPSPNQLTGGEGPVTGQEAQFTVTFTTPIALPPDHYFFIPQVQLAAGNNFYWLSAPRPIVSPGTPFTPDLQAWIRNADLDPDWLRVGTDIVGSGAFNAAFSLLGTIASTPTPTATSTTPSTATPTNTPTSTPTNTPPGTPANTPTFTRTPTGAPVQVPTLSFSMLALLGLALVGTGLLLSRRP